MEVIEDTGLQSIETLSKRISQGICILFLGPETLRTHSGLPVNKAFALSLAEKLTPGERPANAEVCENMPYMIQYYRLAFFIQNGLR